MFPGPHPASASDGKLGEGLGARLLQHGMGSYAKPMEGQELLSYLILFRGDGMKLCVVLQCIFGCEYLSPRTTIVSGIKNYTSACMSSCSDDLTVVTVLRSLKSGVREHISPRINFCLYLISNGWQRMCMYYSGRHNNTYTAIDNVDWEIFMLSDLSTSRIFFQKPLQTRFLGMKFM